MVRWRDEIGERRVQAGRGISLGRTIAGVCAFYAAVILLNGDALHTNAERMPFGPARTWSLFLTAPLQKASRATRLYLLRNWIENAWHKEKQP